MVQPDDIRGWIAAALPCEAIEVGGDGRHFEALIVSERFRGLARVRRHQLVYAALGERMREEIHALSLQTFAPEEWTALHG